MGRSGAGGRPAGTERRRRVRGLTPPLLVFAYGNPSRGDDALGPELLQRLEALDPPDTELLTDFQLQVEHAVDLAGRERVLFIDASVSAPPPFTFTRLRPERDASYTSHAMSPGAVLHAYRELYGTPPPAAYLLAVRGEHYELGAPMSAQASAHMETAFGLLQELCACPLAAWERLQTAPAPG